MARVQGENINRNVVRRLDWKLENEKRRPLQKGQTPLLVLWRKSNGFPPSQAAHTSTRPDAALC